MGLGFFLSRLTRVGHNSLSSSGLGAGVLSRLLACPMLLLVAACPPPGGGTDTSFLALLGLGGGGGGGPAPTYTIGGTLNGLQVGDQVTLQNGSSTLSLTANGPFTLPGEHAAGASYNVQVQSATLGGGRICTAGANSGVVGSANTTDVSVVCAAPATLNVQVTDLSAQGALGSGLVFQNNAADDRTVAAFNTPYAFSVAVAEGAKYSVTVKTSPSAPNQVCSPVTSADANGTMPATAHTVTFGCSTSYYTVHASVSGLASGNSVVLRNNGGNDLSATSNTTWSFSTNIAGGLGYAVTVQTNPTTPNQTCSVTGGGNGSGAGTSSSDVTVTVTCVTNPYNVQGTVSGLGGGESVTLQINGGSNQTITNPATALSFSLADGTAYTVTVLSQPSGKGCKVTNASGTLAGADVTNVTVACGPCTDGNGDKQINVTWTASRSADVHSVLGGGHKIYYDTLTGVSKTTLNVVDVPNTTSTTSGTIPNLYKGCTYFVKVGGYSALNTSGGDLSAESSITVP